MLKCVRVVGTTDHYLVDPDAETKVAVGETKVNGYPFGLIADTVIAKYKCAEGMSAVATCARLSAGRVEAEKSSPAKLEVAVVDEPEVGVVVEPMRHDLPRWCRRQDYDRLIASFDSFVQGEIYQVHERGATKVLYEEWEEHGRPGVEIVTLDEFDYYTTLSARPHLATAYELSLTPDGWEVKRQAVLDGLPKLPEPAPPRGKPYPAFVKEHDPQIDIAAGHNLSELCRQLKLNPAAMRRVMQGKQRSHKGWVLMEVSQ